MKNVELKISVGGYCSKQGVKCKQHIGCVPVK